ncbi:MAG: hypothetical protein JWO82_1592 [Akkermansiaceae bacterium]|nr:hypothetical protein [Akkermansiaceae bacterium]
MVLRLVLGLVLFRTMYQTFNEAQFGFWSLLWSLFGYGLLLDFGFGFTAQKAVAEKTATRDMEGLNGLLATIFWTFVAMAVLIVVVFSLINGVFLTKVGVLPANHDTFRNAYLIFFAGIAVMFPLGLFPEILRGRQRVDLANWVGVGSTLVNFAGLFTGLKLGWSYPVLMGISVGTSIIPNLAAMLMAFRLIPGLRLWPSLFNWRSVKLQLSFSMAAYLIAFSNLLMSKTDQLVLSMTVGVSAVAIYQAGYKMGEMLELFSVQLQSALSPAAASLGARGDRDGLVELLLRSSRLTFILVTPCYALTAVYLDGLIRLLTGMKVVPDETFWVGQALILAIYSSQITNSCSKRVLMMSGHERPLLWISIGDAVLNLVLSVILVRTMGILGVALGTLIATVIAGAFIVFPLTLSRLSLKFREVIAFHAKGTLLPLGLCFGILGLLLWLAPLDPAANSLALLQQLAWRGALATLPVGILSWPILRAMTH